MGINMIYSRKEFISQWEDHLINSEGPMWAYEKFIKHKSVYFIKIKPVRTATCREEFHSWCKQHLSRPVICYSSSESEEWWGFSNEQDINIWCLKWI